MDESTRAIGRLEGKVDLVVSMVAELRNSFEKMEQGRLSTLEVKVANLIGRLTVIIALVSGGTSFAFLLLEKYLTR